MRNKNSIIYTYYIFIFLVVQIVLQTKSPCDADALDLHKQRIYLGHKIEIKGIVDTKHILYILLIDEKEVNRKISNGTLGIEKISYFSKRISITVEIKQGLLLKPRLIVYNKKKIEYYEFEDVK